MKIKRLLAGILAVALLGAFGLAQVSAEVNPSGSVAIPPSFREVASKVLPTVVEVDVVDVVKQPVGELMSPFEFFFGPQRGRNPNPAPQQREFKRFGLGSGVIVQRNGNRVYVLTNNHVVGQASEINAKLRDGRQFRAKLVGKDDKKDLALVVFETTEAVPVALLGDSDTLEAGDWVLAAGSPLGFQSTITAGIVSAVGRESVPGSDLAGFTDYIQTDAAINQGNSGGALVNLQGEVVGINTWIASPSGGNVGLGFAIPINNAKQAIRDFIEKGKVEYGWLGVNIGSLTPEAVKSMRLQGIDGAFIYSVFRGSPADRAGIKPGDLVTAVNGRQVRNSNQLLKTVGNLAPGATTRFDISRLGSPISATVKIVSRDSEESIAGQAGKIWPGLALMPLSDEARKQMPNPPKNGDLVIVSVDEGSAAASAGFAPGDIVLKVNGKQVNSLADFYRTLNEKEGRETIFNISREGNELILGLVKS